jgi:hypothetical protein
MKLIERRRKIFPPGLQGQTGEIAADKGETGAVDVKVWAQSEDMALYQGDALEVLRELPEQSIQCVVTSKIGLIQVDVQMARLGRRRRVRSERGKRLSGMYLSDMCEEGSGFLCCLL